MKNDIYIVWSKTKPECELSVIIGVDNDLSVGKQYNYASPWNPDKREEGPQSEHNIFRFRYPVMFTLPTNAFLILLVHFPIRSSKKTEHKQRT